MKALYSRKYLDHIPFNDMLVPFEKYLHKLEHHRKEITKLKLHEKNFLFRAMRSFYYASGDKRYDYFNIPELKECLFFWVILFYFNMTMAFDGYVPAPDKRLLTPNEKRRNKRFYYEYLNVWKNQIDKGEGAYCSIIKPAIYKKIKDWRSLAERKSIPLEVLKQKELFIYGCFFDIYYHVKLYFDELPHPYIIKKINGIDIEFNVYSYIHIYGRHYIPNMNLDWGDASMNPEMDAVNLDELPDSIFELLEKYNASHTITKETQYCLYKWKGECFILWLKYKRLNGTGDEGIEVRSFYKCTKDEDLSKFEDNNWIELSNNL